MIGDSPGDRFLSRAGRAAGCKTALVGETEITSLGTSDFRGVVAAGCGAGSLLELQTAGGLPGDLAF